MKKNSENHIDIYKKLSSAIQWRKAFLLLFVVLAFGCKDENDIGLNVLPPSDQLNTAYNDTSTIIISTDKDDSLFTDELSLQLLGSDRDPVFGYSTASIFTQANLQGIPSFGDSIKADSLILSLVYYSYYGDTNLVQTVHVYRMLEPMYTDSTYYSDRSFLYDSINELATPMTFNPSPKTVQIVDGQAANPQLRIRLSQTFADSLIYYYTTGSSIFSSNADWLNYFNGMYIKTDPVSGQGAVSYFDFSFSKLTLYFHDTTDTTLKYKYNFSLNNARVNHFAHDYTGFPVEPHINAPNDSISYLLAMSGLKTKISFPFLKHFTDSGSILVNRAEVVIPSELGAVYYPLSSQLFLKAIDAAGNPYFPIDFLEASGYYGGYINSTGDGYTFNITRHIQEYLNGVVPNADFVLQVAGNGVNASRAVLLNGANSSKIKLRLSYTKIK